MTPRSSDKFSSCSRERWGGCGRVCAVTNGQRYLTSFSYNLGGGETPLYKHSDCGIGTAGEGLRLTQKEPDGASRDKQKGEHAYRSGLQHGRPEARRQLEGGTAANSLQ